MKRFFLKKMAFVCLFTAVVLNSCEKDEDVENGSIPGNTITAAVEDGNSYNSLVDSVKLMVGFEIEEEWREQTLAVAEYKNGGFTLVLPESVNSRYLRSFEEDDILDGVTVSNKNVKTTVAVYLYAYKSGYITGEFYLKSGDWEGWLMYVDSDVSMTGTGTFFDTNDDFIFTSITINYNLNLKKGWNIGYQKYAENGDTFTMESTTTAPAGAKWHFESYSGKSFVSGARSGASLLQGKQKFRF